MRWEVDGVGGRGLGLGAGPLLEVQDEPPDHQFVDMVKGGGSTLPFGPVVE